MVDDKIKLLLQDITKLQEKLKDIKKDIKIDEAIEDDQYDQLKASSKDLKQQVKDFEESYLEDLKKDQSYHQLREMKVKTEEEIAQNQEKLFEQVAKLPQKAVRLEVVTEYGPVNIQIQPEMRLYLNGREYARKHKGI